MEMVIHPKKLENNILYDTKGKQKRRAFCGLPHHIKLTIFRIPLESSYKTTRRPSPPNFSSKFVFMGTQ